MADSRVRVNLEAPGQIESIVVDLEPGASALVGRAPDTSRAAISGDVACHTIPAPAVSANHLQLRVTDDELQVRDLGSRNGTWVQVPPHATVRLPRGDAHVRLGASANRADGDGLPESARFRTAADYGEGVARAIREWLDRQELKARVWIADPDSTRPPTLGALSVRLASNELLEMQSEGTVDERFQGVLARVARYVATQNSLFIAEDDARRDGMILASPALRQVHSRIVQLAQQGLSGLLLLGPSGTGKERLARTFHRYSGRDGSLVPINCSALARDRVVADLFGAEAGSYTGAQKAMVGAVERADGGTLFLDEVGELPLEVQPQLLRFLDLGEYQRLGAIGVPRTADVRLVAATNRDLRRMAAENTFRADLFFRLALEVIEVPPLRQRFADVVAYLQTQMLGDTSAHDALTPEALELLRRHTWDGNFRELVNLVRRFPRPATPGSLGAAVVQRALEAGSIEPPRESTVPIPVVESWAGCVQSCLEAYAATGGADPASWSDVVGFVEQFLKPYALVHLAGVASATSMEDVTPARVAERVKADRGTVLKQLRRYFDIPKK